MIISFQIICWLKNNSQAVDYFLALPQNKDLAKHKLSSEDWNKLRDVEFVLSVCQTPSLSHTLLNWGGFSSVSGSAPSTTNHVWRNYAVVVWCYTRIRDVHDALGEYEPASQFKVNHCSWPRVGSQVLQ